MLKPPPPPAPSKPESGKGKREKKEDREPTVNSSAILCDLIVKPKLRPSQTTVRCAGEPTLLNSCFQTRSLPATRASALRAFPSTTALITCLNRMCPITQHYNLSVSCIWPPRMPDQSLCVEIDGVYYRWIPSPDGKGGRAGERWRPERSAQLVGSAQAAINANLHRLPHLPEKTRLYIGSQDAAANIEGTAIMGLDKICLPFFWTFVAA